MKEKKHNQKGKESVSSRHPVIQQLLAALLGLCMIVVSIPVPQFSLSVQAAQNQLELSESSRLPDDTVTMDDGKDDGTKEEGNDTATGAKAVSYRVEHYKQNIEGDGYTRVDADTEYLSGQTGTTVTAEANPYTGFSLSSDLTIGKASGLVEADGSLVLQLYYDRDIYEIEFDLNGGDGIAPAKQTVRYGGLLLEVEEPQRKGYTFDGWYMDKEASETYWEPYQTVEENTNSQKTTLYAKWTDKTAPVLGEASFGLDNNNFMDWVIGQERLVITVPVIEAGSGLKQANYTLISENGDRKKGTAEIRTEYALSSEAHARSGGINGVMAVRGNAGDGEYEVVITIEEEFKGRVALTCTDTDGNTSVEKILTAVGAGVVVEDNAPDIRFSKAQTEASKSQSAIKVEVTDSTGNYATAGLAEISYRIDGGKARAVGEEELGDAMVDNYSFEVDIIGEGEHTLAVTAVDNAGNKSTEKATVEIVKKNAVIIPKPKTPTQQQTSKPAAGEPATGENTQVKIFATLGMVAGFTYLLLYFASGESGITEDEKEEIISRLVRWAKKGKLRKYSALIVIMLFLVYYHSIGKSVGDEWRKVCEG